MKLLKVLLFILFISCKQDANYVEYYDNGKPKLTGTFKNNERTGVWTEYNLEGTKTKSYEYQNGSVEIVNLFVKGKLYATIEMIDSVRTGKTIVYYPTGKIENVMNFKNGIQRGDQQFYNESENLESKYFVDSSGVPTEYYEYFPNGEVSFYAPNFHNSVANQYDSLGKLLYKLIYKNNEIVDTLK